jgi:hypothetical protein
VCSHEQSRGKPKPGFVTPESSKAERIRANGLINKRLKLGWFRKPTRCAKCGVKPSRIDFHHHDYSQPDRGYWLCRSCHVIAHHNPSSLAGVRMFVADKSLARCAENGVEPVDQRRPEP